MELKFARRQYCYLQLCKLPRLNLFCSQNYPCIEPPGWAKTPPRMFCCVPDNSDTFIGSMDCARSGLFLSPHLILLYTSIHHSRSISLGVYGPWGFILTSPILFSPLKNHPSLSVVAFIVALHPQRSIDRNKCALEPFGLSALFSLSVLHGTKCFWVDSFLGVFGLPNKK